MFDNLLMSMNSKLKKIMSGLETNEGKIDEISTDVGSVGTSVATVQSTSDEIKALIGTEIATQLSTLEANVIAAMPSGSSGLTGCIRKIQRGSITCDSVDSGVLSITLSGFSDVAKMIAFVDGDITMAYLYANGLTKTTLSVKYNNSDSTSKKYGYYQVVEFY